MLDNAIRPFTLSSLLFGGPGAMASHLELQEVDSDYDLEIDVIDVELERDVESLQKVLKADDDTEGKSGKLGDKPHPQKL